MAASGCDHKYIHRTSEKSQREHAHCTYYERTEVYFCEKCLEEQRRTRQEHVQGRYHTAPGWYLAP